MNIIRYFVNPFNNKYHTVNVDCNDNYECSTLCSELTTLIRHPFRDWEGKLCGQFQDVQPDSAYTHSGYTFNLNAQRLAYLKLECDLLQQQYENFHRNVNFANQTIRKIQHSICASIGQGLSI